MPPKKEGYTFLIAILIIAFLVSLVSFVSIESNPHLLSIRLFALNGFISLSIAAILTPFLKEVKNAFNRSFKAIHHSFAAIGITLITLHPISVVLREMNPSLFIPNFQSFDLFWYYAGSQALIIIYIAFASAFIRRSIPKYWRIIHAFMYIALFFGIIHANLLGGDLQNPIVRTILNLLFITSIATFSLKRYQQIKQNRMIKRIKEQQKQKTTK